MRRKFLKIFSSCFFKKKNVVWAVSAEVFLADTYLRSRERDVEHLPTAPIKEG